MKAYFFLAISFFCASCALFSKNSKSKNASSTDDTIDYFHGEEVMDPFRWLEDSEDDAVAEWVSKQNRKSNATINATGLQSKINQRLIEIEKTSQGHYFQLKGVENKLFAMKRVPPASQAVLVAMPSYTQTQQAETLIDPNLIDPTGATSIDWYVPSHDGRYVAVSMSKNGTGAGDLYVYDLTKRAPKGDSPSPAYLPIEPVIPNVSRATGGGALAWNMKNRGFYYTRYSDSSDLDGDGALYQKLYFHKLGKPFSKDKLSLGDDFDQIESIELEVDPRSDRLIATVQMGKSSLFKHYLLNPNGKWQQLSTISDGVVEITFAPKGGMYVLSRESAPHGRLQFLSSPKMPLSQSKRIVPECNESIVGGVQGARSILVMQTRIYLVYQLGGPAEIRVFDLKGKKLDTIKIENADIGPDLVPLQGDEILFRVDGFFSPTAWYRYDGILGSSSLIQTALSTTYGNGYRDIVVESLIAISKDGAKVPLFVLKKQNTGTEAPAILMGDGGFGRSFPPRFSSTLSLWLEQGGIVAFAGVRGGGEFGEGWHRAGMLEYKQNSIDDFIACAKHLVDNSYTTTNSLALMGTGNGGLLAGSALVQKPDMAMAVVIDRGIFDLLRLEFNGPGKITVGEYGSVNNESQFKAMIAYSPYHKVEKRTGYPAVFLISGANDKRVLPWQSRKFAAQLQVANTSSKPILYKEIPNAGNGKSTPFIQKIGEEAEKLAFIFSELGINFR